MEINKVTRSQSHKVTGIKGFGRIGVLMGGSSSEREISLKSGSAVYEALKLSGIEAVAIDIKTKNPQDNLNLIESYNIDCAFIALHGCFGEDGQIQGILESLRVPYTGSGVEASRLAMDKIASRRIFEKAGLIVPRYKIVNKTDRKTRHNLEFPLVIKPATGGSSIGLSILDKENDFKPALDLAFSFDKRVVIEEYIEGREVTVGILDDLSLPVIEIITRNKFFDYDAKYKSGLTDYVVPARLEEGISGKVKEAAGKAHRLLGCFACSRVDIILNRDNLPVVLEVNTIPGLTDTSLLPKAAKCVGIDFDKLCIKLIKLAYEKK